MGDSTFQFSPEFSVSDEVKKIYDETGFIIVRNLLSVAEVNRLKEKLENNKGFLSSQNQTQREDGSGMKNKSVLWKNTGNDITGVIARSEKVVDTVEKLLGGKVDHYHSKVVMKEPNTGAFPWHQDYGYWYKYGFLFPYMATVWIAIDKADKENGCLQILKGSHKTGRIDTVKIGDTISADKERTEQLKNVFELIHCEMEPGDAMIFDCNLLHYSEPNMSNRRRWAFITCYNKSDNPATGHKTTPIDKVPNTAIMDDVTDTVVTDDKDFFRFNPQQMSFAAGAK